MKAYFSRRLGWIVLLASLAGLTACKRPTPEEATLARRQQAIKDFQGRNPLHLAVVWKKSNGEFLSGAMLAAEEINAEGGVLGRPLRLEFTDEGPFVENEGVRRSKAEGRYRNALAEAGTDIAKTVMSNPSVTAVIGHMNSDVTLSAMLEYQDNGVLLFSGNSTDSRIMWSSNSLYFQLRPKDDVLAAYIAEDIRRHNWRNSYIVYEATRHNEHVAELLKTAFSKSGVRLAGTVAITAGGVKSGNGMRRLQHELADLSTGSVDAIVLLAPPDLASRVVNKSRSLGVFQPFIGTSELEVPEFIGQVVDPGIDTFFTSLYRKDNYQVRRFSEKLGKRFPDSAVNESAAMGYDSVRLYAEAVASAGTTDPLVLAHALQYKLQMWYGLLGSYIFKEGNNVGLQYYTHRLGGRSVEKLPVSTDDPK